MKLVLPLLLIVVGAAVATWFVTGALTALWPNRAWLRWMVGGLVVPVALIGWAWIASRGPWGGAPISNAGIVAAMIVAAAMASVPVSLLTSAAVALRWWR